MCSNMAVEGWRCAAGLLALCLTATHPLPRVGSRGLAGSGACAAGTGRSQGLGQEPGLPAPSPPANLPIYLSSGDGRQMQGARATTARYGRDSAAAGQGARARSRQRAEGATVGCTNGEAGIHPGASADQVKWGEVRGSSAHNTNLRLPAICRKHSCSGFGELP